MGPIHDNFPGFAACGFSIYYINYSHCDFVHVCTCVFHDVKHVCLPSCVTDDYLPQPVNSPGGSSTSSRDGSPSRDISTLVGAIKPIYILRGHRGYGFTLRAIRVYYGDSDYYTLQHLVVVSLVFLCGS